MVHLSKIEQLKSLFPPLFILYIKASSLIVLAGGLWGFIEKKSVPSLIASLIAFALLWTCSYGLEKNKKWAGFLFGAVSLLLAVFFYKKFLLKKLFFPTGFLASLQTFSLCLFAVWSYFTSRSPK